MFASRKRVRGQDDEEQPAAHDYKKPRILPFRTSPTVKHTRLSSQSPRSFPKPLLTPTTTPVESSDDEEDHSCYPSSALQLTETSSQLAMNSLVTFHDDADLDLDMMDSQSPSCSPRWNNMLAEPSTPPRPSQLLLLPISTTRDTQSMNNGGRIPTPRWGHFRSIDMNIDMCDAPEMRPSQLEADHSLFLRRRRLPSPISEDENVVSSTGMTEEMMYRLDMRSTRSEREPFVGQFQRGKIWAPVAVGPGAVGAKAGKTMLSMGYRSDCEKCQRRVPGHYNHVVRA